MILVKEEVFNNILKGIIDSDNNFKYPVLNRTVSDNRTFYVNADYEFDKFNN